MKNHFGKRMAQIRIISDLTIEQFAKLLGEPLPVVVDMESEGTVVPKPYADKVSAMLKTYTFRAYDLRQCRVQSNINTASLNLNWETQGA